MEMIRRFKERREKTMRSLWRHFQRDFEEKLRKDMEDPLELYIVWPCETDTCHEEHCDGWRQYFEDGDLVDMIYEQIEDFLRDLAADRYDDEFKIDDYVERRMEKMTDKKVVKLIGEDYLDEEFSECPYRDFCPYYESPGSEKEAD